MKKVIPFFIAILFVSCNSGGPSSAPSSSSPPAAEDVSSPAAASSTANEWIELMFIGNLNCSSELEPGDAWEGERGQYNPGNLYDNSPATAWVEGAEGYGTGEYFIADLGYMLPGKIEIRNGYQKSESIFKKNSRVKNARITLFAGYHLPGEVTEIGEIYRARQTGSSFVVTLNDAMGLQEITLPVDMKSAFKERILLARDFKTEFSERLKDLQEFETPMSLHWFLKVEIVDVYPGSDFDDTCISDILFHNMTLDPVSDDEVIKKVYDSEAQDMVLFDTDQREGIVLADVKELKEYKEKAQDVKMAVTIMDTSPDREWAWIDIMSTAEGSRVEEVSSLWHIRSMKRIGPDILDSSVSISGFTEKDGRIWLDTNEGLIDLEKIKKSIFTEKPTN
ncbi:MAG: hypothetical protein V1903_14185 [Bacteroidota bacterium]